MANSTDPNSERGLDGLIEALTIFRKYANPPYPTNCNHDVLEMHGDFQMRDMSQADVDRLAELGFGWDEGGDGREPGFVSYLYGRC